MTGRFRTGVAAVLWEGDGSVTSQYLSKVVVSTRSIAQSAVLQCFANASFATSHAYVHGG